MNQSRDKNKQPQTIECIEQENATKQIVHGFMWNWYVVDCESSISGCPHGTQLEHQRIDVHHVCSARYWSGGLSANSMKQSVFVINAFSMGKHALVYDTFEICSSQKIGRRGVSRAFAGLAGHVRCWAAFRGEEPSMLTLGRPVAVRMKKINWHQLNL